MTEEELEEYDKHHVILLEALGNGCHDDSYVFILSHLNDTNSPWIKRAGIHALRKYQHQHVGIVAHDIAEYDMSRLMRLWLLSSSVNSFFKHACAAIHWGQTSDIWSDPSSTSIHYVCEQRRLAYAISTIIS